MNKKIPGSFRDPSGFMFTQNNILYRQINNVYKENYTQLMTSGLYKKLIEKKLIIHHKEVQIEKNAKEAYKIIQPKIVNFISYPYEWCFSQLKDAALTTLNIQILALDYGMSLKDASAYNIQFQNGKPIFIDTLSFEKYQEGPWIAYRQFCQHFLAPLALISKKDIRLQQLLRIYIDGIPLDLASQLLPFHTRFSFSFLSHIHLHAKSQQYYSNKTQNVRKYKMSKFSLLAILDNLKSIIYKLKWNPKGTEWGDYYSDTNYSSDSFSKKEKLIAELLENINPSQIWDIGANTGTFSRIASKEKIHTISFDIDPAAVEKNYLKCIKENESHILPLVLDLMNPSSGIGWENLERMSWLSRGPANTILALALIHHLAISNNVPLTKIAYFFSKICEEVLIIEFVSKDDSQVQRLLATREDIFQEYTQEKFEEAFSTYFKIERNSQIENTKRNIYLMKKL